MKLSAIVIPLALLVCLSAGCDALNCSDILISSFQPKNVTIGTKVCPECIRDTSVNVLTFTIKIVPSVNYTKDTLVNDTRTVCFIVEVDTNVTCLVTTSDCVINPTAMIYVQGLLPAVTNLSSQVICNNATLHITWKPPPTLQEVPIITNVINISRFDDGESVNSANTTTGEISEYHYNASNQLGETLVIAVTPVNDLGLGNSTKINIIVPMTCVGSSTIRMSTPTETTANRTPIPTQSPTDNPGSTDNIAAIVGGIFGGIFVVLVVIGICYAASPFIIVIIVLVRKIRIKIWQQN